MIQVCPTCGGGRVGCPTCNAPPRRVLPKEDIYKGKPEHRKMMALYGAPVWEVQAVDLCVYSGHVDFNITKTKAQIVILRYGYGDGWKDGKLDEYYAGAKAAGMPIGGYWYNQIGRDPIKHADSFAELLASHPVDLDIHDDNEETTLGTSQTLAWIITNEDRLQSRTGKIPVPYSSKNFWDNKVAYSTRWMNRKTWPANWTVRDYPVVPNGWVFNQGCWWQWSANGNGLAASYGSTGGDSYIDLVRWYGSVEQFNPTYRTNIKHLGEPIPPPLPGQVPESVIINIGELAIHDTPQLVQTNVVGHALINTTWHPFEQVYVDGVKMYRVTKDGLISAAYTRLP